MEILVLRGQTVPGALAFSLNLCGINGTLSIAETGARAVDFPRANRSYTLKEADFDRVWGLVPGSGKSASLCGFLSHLWILERTASLWLELMEGASPFFGLEEDLLPCLCA